MRRHRGRHSRAQRHVVLHRAQDAAEAQLWADACQSVLRSLNIASWWQVSTDPADGGATLVSLDYDTPEGTMPR